MRRLPAWTYRSGWKKMKKLWQLGGAAVLCALILSACGGGGGGGDHGASPSSDNGLAPETVAVTFDQPNVQLSVVEGEDRQVNLQASFDHKGTREFYVFAEEDERLSRLGDSHSFGTNLPLFFGLASDLSVGVHDSEIVLRMCHDEACQQELVGSPVRLPVHVEVKPNIQVSASSVVLQRLGRDAAPSKSVDVSVPAEAGSVTASWAPWTPAGLSMSFDGSRLTIEAGQIRAGTYQGTVLLQSQGDRRYSKTVNVSYTVAAPADGEKEFGLSQYNVSLNLDQGKTVSTRIKVVRPSWSNAWSEPVLTSGAPLFSIKRVSDDEYDIVANAQGIERGTYSGSVRFSADHDIDVPLWASVEPSFTVNFGSSEVSFNLSDAIVEAQLKKAVGVSVRDSVVAAWHAVSQAPWLKVINPDGLTGNALWLEVDKAQLPLLPGIRQAVVEVGIDRPGTEKQRLTVTLNNDMQAIRAAVSGSLVGSQGMVVLTGNFKRSTDWAQMVSSGRLSVTGAKLLDQPRVQYNAQAPQYSEVVPNDPRLLLQLSDAKPGTPVKINFAPGLLATQVQVNVVEANAAPAGYVALPFGAYRPPRYVPALHALYWAGEGKIFRWAHDEASWQLTQASLSGVIDASVSSDESRVYALVENGVLSYDVTTVTYLREGVLAPSPFGGTYLFDKQASWTGNALVNVIDGRSFASIVNPGDSASVRQGVAWITGEDGLAASRVPDLSITPHLAYANETNSFRSQSAGNVGATLMRSPNGRAMAVMDANQGIWVYRVDGSDGFIYGAYARQGLGVAALTDDGLWLKTDGSVIIGGIPTSSSVAGKLPLTHVAGAYGITGDGRFALIYGYRLEDRGNGSQRAADAALWVIDASHIYSSDWGDAPILGRIPLPDAVGCTSTSLASGETCRHQAVITMDPSGLTAFITGPRGVAAVPLPQTWPGNAAVAVSSSGRASAQSMSLSRGAKPQSKRVISVIRGAYYSGH